MTVTSKTEFTNVSAILCGRMVSLDRDTQIAAANEAQTVLADLPKFLANSPHCHDEIETIKTLISRAIQA